MNGIVIEDVEGCDVNGPLIEKSSSDFKEILKHSLLFNNKCYKDWPPTSPKKETKNMELNGHTNNNNSSSDSDLVVVSVVLNTKQKENDEVAKAIERLRENGVNCVFFTMNDIIHGNRKDGKNGSTECIQNGQISPLKNSMSKSDPVKHQADSTVTLPLTNGHSKHSDHSSNMISSQNSTSSSNDKMSSQQFVPNGVTRAKKRRRRKKYPYSITRKKKPKLVAKVSDVALNPPGTPDEAGWFHPLTEHIPNIVSSSTREMKVESPEVQETSKSEDIAVTTVGLIKEETIATKNGISKPPDLLEAIGLSRKLAENSSQKTTHNSTKMETVSESPKSVSEGTMPLKSNKVVVKEGSIMEKSESCVHNNNMISNNNVVVQELSKDLRALSNNFQQVEEMEVDESLYNVVNGEDETNKNQEKSSKHRKKGRKKRGKGKIVLKVKLPIPPPPIKCDTSVQQDDKTGVIETENIISEPEIPKVKETQVKMEPETIETSQVSLSQTSNNYPSDSLPDSPEGMQLRSCSSFYSLIAGNVRTNLENYLDGTTRSPVEKSCKRRRKYKNGFLLHHGDNYPENPESPYKLHLATQVLLKLNKRRSKFRPKEEKGKSLLSYLKLAPKRSIRKTTLPNTEETTQVTESDDNVGTFSGEWTIDRKYVCNICGQVEETFWDMVTHKGEFHPGVVVTHVELSHSPPPSLVRQRPQYTPVSKGAAPKPPPCTKCSKTFSHYTDLHKHIFECAGNTSWLQEYVPKKKKSKRRRGMKRKISSTPKKSNGVVAVASQSTSSTSASSSTKKTENTARRSSCEVFKCDFCQREFKTEGWLKNHLVSHSLPVSIPLEKLPLPFRASSLSRRLHLASVQ